MNSKPYVGQRVRLSAYGFHEGLVRTPEDAECAKETVITWVSEDNYISGDCWAVEVEGPLNRYMLTNDHFEAL